MKYFYSILIGFFLIACGDHSHKNQITYKFTDQEGRSMKIMSDFETFDIFNDIPKPQDIEKTTLIMFLDLNSEDSKNYIVSMNHLRTSFPKVYIATILTQKYPKTEIEEYVQANKVSFPVLNPADNKNLLNDFFKKINESEEKTDPADKAQADQMTSSVKLPFFVMYDRHGKKYQTYSGVIPEEMFDHDIDYLSKKH
ncbi:hypothetical protein BKH42_04795 [Helicobacter sp. 13S00482-2]|uniref:hypothetical protein n=1 Tax=Helicobacter sp. 13S00482-2 TaxID=1476200 RepID=UPI000BA73810|nr:hypothetical protein [Helicobacter sp. 13S00482-2]PAF53640.1 hypothetical protein BKH42_04795 [Helicobacter sp. 13S00482-2]